MILLLVLVDVGRRRGQERERNNKIRRVKVKKVCRSDDGRYVQTIHKNGFFLSVVSPSFLRSDG